MKKPTPLNDNLLVELVTKEQKPGAFIIPEDQGAHRTAKVVAVGPGRFVNGALQPTSVKEGDLVLLPAHGSEKIVVEGKEYQVVNESVVLVIL